MRLVAVAHPKTALTRPAQHPSLTAGKQREVLRLQAAVCHKSTQDATDAVEALSAKAADAVATHAAAASQLQERQSGSKELLARLAAAQKASEEATSQHSALVEKYQSLDRRFVKAQEDHKHAKATVRKLQVGGGRAQGQAMALTPTSLLLSAATGSHRAEQRRCERVASHRRTRHGVAAGHGGEPLVARGRPRHRAGRV